MKDWPKDDGIANFEDVVGPVVKILREYLKDRRKRKARVYEGYTTGTFTRAVCHDPEWQFSKDGLSYHHEHDRDIVDVAAMVLVQLGIEQGRRMCTEHHKVQKTLDWYEGYQAAEAKYKEKK